VAVINLLITSDKAEVHKYRPTCIKRSWPLGQRKSGSIRQVTS